MILSDNLDPDPMRPGERFPSHELIHPESSYAAGQAGSASPRQGSDATAEPQTQEPEKKSTPFHLAVASSCLLALVLALLLRAFVAQAYEIRGKSMEPTLHDGEKVMISKLSPTLHSVERGDLIIFSSPQNSSKDLIKRVVAVGGDTFEIENGRIYVNGVKLSESYVNHELYPRRNSSRIVSPVKPGHVVVLGDNRPNSQDSRHFGAVNLKLIKGKVFLRWWPLSSMTTFP